MSVSIVADSSDQLFVYVDYIYSGSHGDKVTTCGSIIRNGRGGNWSCSPTAVGKGRGFVTLRFGLSFKAREIECSDEIEIHYYDQRGIIFFAQKFPFKKTWVKKGGESIVGKEAVNFSV